MDIVTREDLNELVERQAGPCLSIYQPTHRVGPDTRTYAQQDLIRFRTRRRRRSSAIDHGRWCEWKQAMSLEANAERAYVRWFEDLDAGAA
jgi:hypothetical protein